MWVREGKVVLVLALLVSARVEAQTCVQRNVPGPPLIQHDLTNLMGAVSLRPDGLVTESTRHVYLPRPDSVTVEVDGKRMELRDLAERGVVFCANSILAYPTGPAAMRLLNVESGATHEFQVRLDSASVTQMSDGSLWYRLRSRPVTDAGVQWYRLDADGSMDTVWTTPSMVLLDAWEEMLLLGERGRTENGGRVGHVVTRPPG